MRWLLPALLLCCLGLVGCGHRESAQAAVHIKVSADAILAAKTIDQAKAIAGAIRQWADSIVARESADADAPPMPRFTSVDLLTAVDPDAEALVRKAAADRINQILVDDLTALRKAGSFDAALSGGWNWIASLLGATTVGGIALGLFGKARAVIQTMRSSAQVATDGWHQATAALRTLSPEAAERVDQLTLHLQERLPPAVRSTVDGFLTNARAAPLVVPTGKPEA